MVLILFIGEQSLIFHEVILRLAILFTVTILIGYLLFSRFGSNPYRTFFESSPNPIVLLDGVRITRWNNAAVKFFGCREEEMKEKSVGDFSLPAQLDGNGEVLFQERLEQVRKSGKVKFRWLFRSQRGRHLNAEVTLSRFGSNESFVMATVREITEKICTDTGSDSEKLKLLLENSFEIVAALDRNGMVKYVSQSVKRILGYDREDVIGQEVFEFCHLDDRSRALKMFRRVVSSRPGESQSATFRIRENDGAYRHMEVESGIIPLEDGFDGIFINARDVTAIKESEEKALFYAFHDSLTQLPNKDSFTRMLDIEILKSVNRKRIFAVMCADVEGFKNINEIYGTEMGDIVIRDVASRLKNTVREGDVVSRFMGDKFLILFSDINSVEDAVSLGEKVTGAFLHPFGIGEEKITLGANLGISLYPNDGESADSLIKNSETAMYMAKEKNSGGYRLFDVEMNERMVAKHLLVRELREAVKENQFRPFFQPKVDGDGVIVGMEALVRWFSPTRGMVSPALFIPSAEESGIIRDIGRSVLSNSLGELHGWKGSFENIKLAVNLSPLEFKDRELLSFVTRLLEEKKVPGPSLELEITETALIENEREAIITLEELKNLGITIAIDDFGTGFSSLIKLKQYPVDVIKIDRAFVGSIPEDERSLTIVASIIELSRNLGFEVVAEGVENVEQLEILKKLGCNCFQGFLFSRPVDTGDMSQLLERGRITIS